MTTKITPLLSLSLALLLAAQAHAYPTRTGFDCKQEQHGLFSATRTGNLKVLQLYLDNKCPLNIHDARGFSLYDIASLEGQKETIEWLIAHNVAKEGQYSASLYKLLQTGLRFLNHDAGVVDGKMNAATADGIKSFQKSIKQTATGKPSITWLPIFDQQLTKKMQTKLNELGFKAGGIDGIIGKGTRSAMQAFRQERKMPKGEYAYIDDQLIYQLMMAENEANKKAIARREAEQAARQIAQQAAQRQEEARARAEAQRRATEKRQQAEAAAAEAQRRAQEKRQQVAAAAAKNQQIAQNQRAADEAATRALEEKAQREAERILQNAQQKQAESQHLAQLAQQQQAAAEQQRLAQQQAAAQQAAAEQQRLAQQQAEKNRQAAEEAARLAKQQAEAQQRAEAQRLAQQQAEAQRLAQQQAAALAEKRRLAQEAAEKEAARQREIALQAERAKQAAEEARKAEALARKQAEEAAKAAELARTEARSAFKAAETGKPIFALNSSRNTNEPPAEKVAPKAPEVQGQKTRTPGFQKVAGRLQLQGKGRQLMHCSLGGKSLDVGWCKQYYPSGAGKRCQAVVSNTGVVVSLTCK